MTETFNATTYFIDRHVDEGRADSIAIECGDDRISYRGLQETVNRFGSALKDELGVRPEERVLLLTLDGPEMVSAFFGAIKIGAVPVPLNTAWTSADYDYVLRDARPRVLIVSPSLLPRLGVSPLTTYPWVRHIVVATDEPDGYIALTPVLQRASASLEAEATTCDSVAFWLYSSGSTGRPKGCVHLQHDMRVCAESYAQGILQIAPADRCFSVAKLFFAYGLGNAMYFPFSVGATAILWPGAVTPSVIYGIIERYRPTLFFSVPTHYAMLLAHRDDSREPDLSSIRCAVSAGESLPAAIFERFRTRFGIDILDGLGSTEVLHIFISNRPGHVKPGSSGQLVPGYEARLVDEAGVPVDTGSIGTLMIRGDSTCAYYWNKHEHTKETISGHWINTGDKYHVDEDGYFFFAGRSDDMLKVGGIWVSPAEVESVLLEHQAVQACGVVGRSDEDGLVKPAAFVVTRPGVPASASLATELQQFVRARLAEYKRPRWVEFLDALPTTATGKIQRFKLRQRSIADRDR
jgi:benzoate-CoA ligase family protein